MVGLLFTISSINIARAAIRKTDRWLGLGTPLELSVGSHDPDEISRLYIRVHGPNGQNREIDVDDAAVEACLSGLADVDALVNEVDAKVREAARDVLA